MKNIYRFKPGRTFAQALAALLLSDSVGVLDVDWIQALSVAAMAGLVSLLQIWGEGGDMLADDTRVTRTATTEPDDPALGERILLDEDEVTRGVSRVQGEVFDPDNRPNFGN